MFGLMMLSFIPSLFVMPILQIMPVFTAEVLHAKANIYGYLMTSFGVGALLATLTMASFGSLIRSGWLGISGTIVCSHLCHPFFPIHSAMGCFFLTCGPWFLPDDLPCQQ